MANRTRPRTWSERVYETLLSGYPPPFRRRAAEELQEMFRDARAATDSVFGVGKLWLRTIIDLAVSVPAEWWALTRRRGRPQHQHQTRASLMETFVHDVRYGLRTLIKSPGFAVTVLLTLTLGIGANTAIFSLINEVLLRPLPVHDQDRLVQVYTSDFSSGVYGGSSYPDYEDFRDNSRSLDDLAAFSFPVPLSLGVSGQADRISGQLVSGNYFDVLGVPAAAGRMLAASDDVSVGAHPVAVISFGTWQRRFGGDPGVVGRSVALNGYPFTVVGVAPEKFAGVEVGVFPEIWIPLTMYGQALPFFAGRPILESRGGRWLRAVGRLATGVTATQAQIELRGIMGRLAEAFPRSNLGTLQQPDEPRPVTVVPVREAAVGANVLDATVNRARLLMAIVGMVLLIACANVANLFLARANRRQREVAVRLAMGAGRGRIARQMLTESVLLSLAGGAAGLVFAYVLARMLIPLGLPTALQGTLSVPELAIDTTVLGYTLGISMLTGLLFGSVPALRASRPDLVPALKDTEALPRAAKHGYGVRDALVVLQLAGALVLLVGAGLFVRSTVAAYQVDLGFNREGVVLATIDAGQQGFDQEEGEQFFRQVLERTRALPGVREVSLSASVPVSADGSRTTVQPEGYEAAAGEDLELNFNVVSDGYFETLEIPIVAGRSFTAADDADAPRVMIVNQTFAERFWPGENPIGKQVTGRSNAPPMEVIGVAVDGKYKAVREDPLTYMYFPLAQAYQGMLTLAVRSSADPASLVPPIRESIRTLNANIPVFDVQPLREHFGAALAQERSTATMISALGLLALILAAVGIYGVVTYAVSQRSREFGVRTALGAQAGDVIGLVVGRGLRLAGVGVVIGVITALALGSVARTFIVGVSPTDPLTFGAVAASLVVVTVLASLIPAVRAARVDPMRVLREE